MQEMHTLSRFFKVVQNNPFIGPSHISLYAALMETWSVHGFEQPLLVKRADIMLLARIAGTSTYHKLIKDLVASGCIKYEPRFDRKGSRIYF